MQLNPERLHPHDTLLRIPDDIIDAEPVNVDNVLQALREEVTGPIKQTTLAGSLHFHRVDAHIVLDALTGYFHDMEIYRA